MTARTTQIDAAVVKALREKTGAGIMDCKQALQEAKGDMAEAEKILRKKGIAVAGKKAGRTANEGCIASYIHHGSRLGVLVEVNCETDFVARTDSFREFVKDITQHIAATNPSCIRREDVLACGGRVRKGNLSRAGQGQAAASGGENRRGQTGEILFHRLFAGAAVRQKSRGHRQRSFDGDDCATGREHRCSPVHSLATRRRNRGSKGVAAPL